MLKASLQTSESIDLETKAGIKLRLSQMDSMRDDNSNASFSDDEMKQIFIKLAKDFVKEENFLLPVINTPVNSPPIEYLNFLGSLDESEKTIKPPKIEEESITQTEGGISAQTMPIQIATGGKGVMGSSQRPAYPTKSVEGSYQDPVLENMMESNSQEEDQNKCESEEEVTSSKRIRQKFRNRESAARSRSRKQARNLQIQMEIKNLKEENQFENRVLEFLSDQNTKLKTGGQEGLRRTLSASNMCLSADTD